jgi:hypothetical protein
MYFGQPQFSQAFSSAQVCPRLSKKDGVQRQLKSTRKQALTKCGQSVVLVHAQHSIGIFIAQIFYVFSHAITVQLGREVLDIGARALRVGATTEEIDRVVHEACIERDCYPSPLNYYKFPKSVCT